MVRPKGTTIICVGGPKNQRTYNYPAPLPNSIAFVDHSQGTQEVYYRKPNSCTYIHANEIPDVKLRQALGLED